LLISFQKWLGKEAEFAICSLNFGHRVVDVLSQFYFSDVFGGTVMKLFIAFMFGKKQRFFSYFF